MTSSPDGHLHLLVLHPLHVEAHGGDGVYDLVKVQLVLHSSNDKTKNIRYSTREQRISPQRVEHGEIS